MGHLTEFRAGDAGRWRIVRIEAMTGPPIELAERLAVVEADGSATRSAAWILRGVQSYERYVRSKEQAELRARSPELGRPEATRAALIPIRKSDSWWDLAQDERRGILEEESRHIATGLKYLPAVARSLYHCRDLGEPFDFLTWFEYAPRDAEGFEELVGQLRETEEWTYVEREIDIRVTREADHLR